MVPQRRGRHRERDRTRGEAGSRDPDEPLHQSIVTSARGTQTSPEKESQAPTLPCDHLAYPAPRLPVCEFVSAGSFGDLCQESSGGHGEPYGRLRPTTLPLSSVYTHTKPGGHHSQSTCDPDPGNSSRPGGVNSQAVDARSSRIE
jgi:hypothetical protein